MKYGQKKLEIDGSTGEGGGQVLRSSLSLSIATGQPVRIANIRAGRAKPGLMRQHLTCVRAAAAISAARTEGDAIGSTEITFEPTAILPGDYEFKVGTAGSCLLVLQTVLPPLLLGDKPSTILLEGGTHNPASPPFEVIERAYLPALSAMGSTLSARLERPGFMPAGGGRVVVEVEPGPAKPFAAMTRGEISRCYAEALFSNLPVDIAKRELQAIGARLDLADDDLRLRQVRSDGPGNALIVTIDHDLGTEVIAEFGMRGRSAETVAKMAASEAEIFLNSEAAIGRHLADQLMVPMVLLQGGRFTTVKPSRHSVTNADIIRQFAPKADAALKIGGVGGCYEIEVTPMTAGGQFR